MACVFVVRTGDRKGEGSSTEAAVRPAGPPSHPTDGRRTHGLGEGLCLFIGGRPPPFGAPADSGRPRIGWQIRPYGSVRGLLGSAGHKLSEQRSDAYGARLTNPETLRG